MADAVVGDAAQRLVGPPRGAGVGDVYREEFQVAARGIEEDLLVLEANAPVELAHRKPEGRAVVVGVVQGGAVVLLKNRVHRSQAGFDIVKQGAVPVPDNCTYGGVHRGRLPALRV